MQLLYEKMIINHLGSTAFVTDGNATITQGFLYAPFGEIIDEYSSIVSMTSPIRVRYFSRGGVLFRWSIPRTRRWWHRRIN